MMSSQRLINSLALSVRVLMMMSLRLPTTGILSLPLCKATLVSKFKTKQGNSVLSLAKHIEHSDCILPIENQALFDICERIQTRPDTVARKSNSAISDTGSNKVFGGLVSSSDKRPKAWDTMNNIVSNLLLNMTR